MSQSQTEEWVTSVCGECGASLTFALGSAQVQCSFCGGGLAVEKGQRLIRLACPRCDGNFYYIDGALTGRCPYCSTNLLVLSEQRILRYLVRPTSPRPAPDGDMSLMFLPFWHLGGLLYSWAVGSKIEITDNSTNAMAESGETAEAPVHRTIRRDSGPQKVFSGRVLDLTIADPAAQSLGITSLRYRGAVFPLEPLVESHEALGQIVPPSLGHQVAQQLLLARAMSVGTTAEGLTRVDCRRVDLVADSIALYYYPFWVSRGANGELSVWDAVSGAREGLAEPIAMPSPSAVPIFDQLRIIDLVCGGCGEPLPPGNHSVVFPCQNCGQFWQLTEQQLAPLDAQYAKPHLPVSDLLWLPYWRIPVQVAYAGKEARRVADLLTHLGLYRVPVQLPQAPAETPLCYFAPGFGGMRAPRIDHAARDMTRHQPLMEPGSPGKGILFHCFFSPQDAVRLAYITWIMMLPGVVLARLRSLRVKTDQAKLWYVPFENSGRELRNLLTGLCYDWDVFRGIRH